MKHAALAFWASMVVRLTVLPTPVSGQELTYEDGYIHYVEGSTHLQRALEPEPEPGQINLPVLPGDRIWTEANSRVEIRFSGGTILRLDERTKVDVIDLGSQQLFHVWSGSIIVAETGTAVCRIDSPAGSVQTQTEGTYRIDVEGVERITLSVSMGVAELSSDRGAVVVRRGQRSVVGPGQAPNALWAFHTTDYDAFDRWSAERGSSTARSSRSTVVPSLPLDVQPYTSELAAYGDWRVNSELGSVWYPSVGVGWAPYRDGRWCYTPYGYTWVSYERWGWAPYHYGRWGYDTYGWYWIPGRHWGPAWVSFAVGPVWIGWSPLGHHGRPVYGFHSVFRRDRYARTRGRRPYRGGKAVSRPFHDRNAGWNFVDRRHFARGRVATARLRIADVERGSARARLFEEGAVLNRDFTARAVGSEAVRRDLGTRGRAIRRTTATIGRQARTALRTNASHNRVQTSRHTTSPSRTQRSTPVRRTRGLSGFAARSGVRSSPSEAVVGRPQTRVGRRDSFSRPSQSTVGDRGRIAPDSSRARGRPAPRRGGRTVSQGTERGRPPARSRATSTRGRSSTPRHGASMSSSDNSGNRGVRSGNRGVRSGNRAPSRASSTRGSRVTTRGGSRSNRGLSSNAGRATSGRARARKR